MIWNRTRITTSTVRATITVDHLNFTNYVIKNILYKIINIIKIVHKINFIVGNY